MVARVRLFLKKDIWIVGWHDFMKWGFFRGIHYSLSLAFHSIAG